MDNERGRDVKECESWIRKWDENVQRNLSRDCLVVNTAKCGVRGGDERTDRVHRFYRSNLIREHFPAIIGPTQGEAGYRVAQMGTGNRPSMIKFIMAAKSHCMQQKGQQVRESYRLHWNNKQRTTRLAVRTYVISSGTAIIGKRCLMFLNLACW